jgi:GT2 family glycosyltransferase
MPELTIVLPTFGHFDFARRAAESLFAVTPQIDLQCLVVDDCSPDWDSVDWSAWPQDRLERHHFNEWAGLTRSWNWGLSRARELGSRYAVCTNSDILFTPGWFEPLRDAIEAGVSLAGPLSNAPGYLPTQDIERHLPGYRLTDDPAVLADYATALRARYPGNCHKPAHVNGFFMMAKTDVWWSGAFDAQHVFDPKHRLTGNEDELQTRWKKMNRACCYVPSSFIFHYRSVSRGFPKLGNKGAFRPTE